MFERDIKITVKKEIVLRDLTRFAATYNVCVFATFTDLNKAFSFVSAKIKPKNWTIYNIETGEIM